MIKRNDILYFGNLSLVPHLIHGFSTRVYGDMHPTHPKSTESLNNFAEVLSIDPQKLVKMHQVHNRNVMFVDGKDAGNKIEETDGLLTAESDVFLSVVTADCVPVLLCDKEKHIVGAVHAGWRGVYKEILKEAVDEMVGKGSNPEDIIVGIGPSIRVCCYEVAEEHADMFSTKFSQWDDYVIKKQGKSFLNLQLLVKYQLRSLGILDTNIEDGEICTAESSDLYSCRKEGEGFGEFVGIIGVKS